MEKAIIVGLGNITDGDFGVGCYILEALALEPFEDRIQLLYIGDDPRCLAGIIYDADLVIVVGALPLGGQPGWVHKWSYRVLKQHIPWLSNENRTIRLLMEALVRAELARDSTQEIIFIWIEPGVTEGYGLSRHVHKAIWKTTREVKHTLFESNLLPEKNLGVTPMYTIA
jgi:hydrogenase maturation protease